MAAAPAAPVVQAMLQPPSDADTLSLFDFTDDAEAAAIEAHIAAHPITLALRADPELTESRPHLKIPAAMRPRNLTAGTLAGAGRLTVPPLGFADSDGRRYTQILHIGADVCGHPGLVHGGLLATLLDEATARCCFAALPHRVGVTASLKIDYRAPARADQYVVIRCETTAVEGRKAWVRGRIETLPAKEGDKVEVIAEAEALFVSPKAAATMAKLYPIT